LGDLNGRGSCALPAGGLGLSGGGSYSCGFSADLLGNAGESKTDWIRVVASDDEGTQVEPSASVTVEFTDVPPAVTVAKLASPDHLPEPGGMVQFSVRVTNQGGEPVRLTALLDESLGDLTGWGTCLVPSEGLLLASGDSYLCTFEAEVWGGAGESRTNSVRITALDDEGNQVEETARVTVTIDTLASE
jgi:hypothetical protein